MTILRESMTKFPLLGCMFRVWREEVTKPPFYDSRDEVLSEARRLRQQPMINEWGLAEGLLNLDRVNAVEVLDSNGEGMVCYKDWP